MVQNILYKLNILYVQTVDNNYIFLNIWHLTNTHVFTRAFSNNLIRIFNMKDFLAKTMLWFPPLSYKMFFNGNLNRIIKKMNFVLYCESYINTDVF